MSVRIAASIAVGLSLAACTVGPDYHPPEPFVPDAWKNALAAELEQPGTPLETWWLALNDPTLTALIDRVGDSNRTLLSAVARIQESRALLGIAGGGYKPDVVLDAAYSRSQPSDNGALGALPGGFDAADLFSAGLGVSWEIDVFGRVRRGVEAARANLGASVEDYRDVLVILFADVASSYVDVRTLQSRLDYARDNVEAQQETTQLTRDRFNAGLTSARDVAQAESNLANSEAAIPLLEAALEASLNRISTLLGDVPGTADGLLQVAEKIPEPNEQVAASVPADLLRRRPDVRRAERRIAAQTALIGVARADLYPTFSLTGAIGLESTDSGALVESDSTTWALIPGLRWSVFSGGKIRNRIRVEEARTEQALLAYEQTVLLALEEVESSLVAFERERVRRDRLLEAVDATERTVGLVRTQYLSGLTDFQSYLDAQRSLFSQQDQLAVSEGQVVQNLITLNRALGGGWSLATTNESELGAAVPAERVDIGSLE